MKNILLIFALTSTLLGCGGSSGGSTTTTTTPIPDPIPDEIILPTVADYQLQNTDELLAETLVLLEGLTIDEFFEQAYLLTQKRNIGNVIADGQFEIIDEQDLNLENISDAYTVQTSELYALILDLLLDFDRAGLTENQQISYDVYIADLEYKQQWIANLDFEYPATYGFFGRPGATESFFTQAFTFNNKEQAEMFLTLLNQLQRRFTQIEALLDAREAKGIIEPAITLGFSQEAVANMANSSAMSTSYYQAFNNQLSALTNINNDDKQLLRDTLVAIIEQKVQPAYQSLSLKMLDLITLAPANIGFGQFTGGKDFYDFTLRFYTSSNLSADQIHELGLEELARIQSEMEALFVTLGYPLNESLSQLYSRVDNGAQLVAANETQTVYENLIADAYIQLPNLFLTLPEQEVIVVGGESGGYYIAGSDDGSRPGAFYANTVNDMPYTTMPTLAYHEAVPGHHLQIALANELDLPQFRRKSNFTSFIEGWGLYAERLAKESGWYDSDVYGDLGRLQFEAMRAARLVIDTGIHNKGWSYDQANQFHITHVGFGGSIARYSVWPGQATAYTTGMIKILELKQQAIDELGELYDVKEFHHAVIGSGSMPLDILQTVVENYIANKIAEPTT